MQFSGAPSLGLLRFCLIRLWVFKFLQFRTSKLCVVAAPVWATATWAHYAKYLRAIATKITERKPELAKYEAADCGKPLGEAAWDIVCFDAYVCRPVCSRGRSPARLRLNRLWRPTWPTLVVKGGGHTSQIYAIR